MPKSKSAYLFTYKNILKLVYLNYKCHFYSSISLMQWFPTWVPRNPGVPRTMFRGSAGFFDESMYVRKYLNHFEIVINIILGICIPN